MILEIYQMSSSNQIFEYLHLKEKKNILTDANTSLLKDIFCLICLYTKVLSKVKTKLLRIIQLDIEYQFEPKK